VADPKRIETVDRLLPSPVRNQLEVTGVEPVIDYPRLSPQGGSPDHHFRWRETKGFSSRDSESQLRTDGTPFVLIRMEPMTGIEPAYSAWEADVLPLNYIGNVAWEG
jgi:hypothetical protein